MMLTYLLTINRSLSWLAMNVAAVERKMVTVQRLLNFSTIPQEKFHQAPSIGKVPKTQKDEVSFRDSGSLVEFKNVQLRYRPTTELVLKDMTFTVERGMKVGIVGQS